MVVILSHCTAVKNTPLIIAGKDGRPFLLFFHQADVSVSVNAPGSCDFKKVGKAG